jgi:hypothetical protein
MNFKVYLNILFILFFLNSPVTLIGDFLGFEFLFPLFFLIPFLILDLVFILSNFKHIKFDFIILVLVLLVVLSLIIGLYNNEFSRKTITDFAVVVIFLLKIILFKNFILKDYKLIKRVFDRFMPYFIYSATLTISLFLIFSQIKFIYAGLTLQLLPYFTNSLFIGSLLKIFYTIVLVFFSGKRASLLSFLLVFILFFLNKYSIKIKLVVGIFLIFLFSIIARVFVDFESVNPSIDKYKSSLDQFDDFNLFESFDIDDPVLDVLSAGRTSEINSVFNTLSPFHYFFGKGCGFVYTNYRISQDEFMFNYSNVHFSPLNILSKYGAVFFIFFYLFLLKFLFNNNPSDFVICSKYIVIGYLFESLFSYLFFVDMLFPLFIAISQTRKIYGE